DSVTTKKGVIGLTLDTLYAGLGQIKIIPDRNNVLPDNLTSIYFILNVSSQVPGEYLRFIKNHPEIHTNLVVGVFKGKNLIKEIDLKQTAQQISEWKEPFLVKIPINVIGPILPDALRFSIRSKNYPPTHNS